MSMLEPSRRELEASASKRIEVWNQNLQERKQRLDERVGGWVQRFEEQTEVSEEYEFLVKNRACPSCHAPAGVLNSNIERLRDGRPLRRLGFAGRRAWYDMSSLVSDAPPDSSLFSRLSLRCKSCNGEFPLFKQGALYGEWECTNVHETERSEEAIGEDAIEISNASSTDLVRTLRVSKEWTSTYSVDETTSAVSSRAFRLPQVKATVSRTLEEKYSIATGEKRVVEEEISITVPAGTAVKVVLGWKRIWQHGYLELVAADKSIHQVPFRVALASTFDQRQVELAAT